MTARRDDTRRATARLNALFLAALAGVVLILALTVSRIGGPVALGAFLGVVAGVAVVLVRRARRLIRERAQTDLAGRTCTCCTTSQHDPVTVR